MVSDGSTFATLLFLTTCMMMVIDQGGVELDWYEIGQVVAIDNGTDYVYTGDTDIWPGIPIMAHPVYRVVLMVSNTTTDGVVPYDGIPRRAFVAVALPVTVVYVFLASTGILFAFVCLVFNYIYRKKK